MLKKVVQNCEAVIVLLEMKHRLWILVAGKSPLIFTVSVQFGNANCGINGRGVTITIYGIPDARNWNGNENHWRLNDADNNVCQPTFGHCLVAYGPMDANNCSALTNTSTDFIYTFAIDASVEGSRATQAYDHSYFITCKYGRNGTATSSFEPIHELDDSTTGKWQQTVTNYF